MVEIQITGIERPIFLEILASPGSKYIIKDRLEITIQLDKELHRIIIPNGFETDVASIPRILWPIFPPLGIPSAKYGMPAILHDYLYSGKVFPRKLCDEIFLQAMKQWKVGYLIRTLIYLCVRLFGKSNYRDS